MPKIGAKRKFKGKKLKGLKYIESEYMGTYRDWETDRKSTRLNSSH